MARGFAAMFGVLLAAWAAIAAAAPCAGFLDVDDSSPFCVNVTWMKNRGVTLGCTHNQYCPNDATSRLQMAAFMHRLGESLFPLSCAAGQVMKWNGLVWSCANDLLGGAGGGGTVTSVAAGTGLQGVPNPITGAGTIAADTTYLQRRVLASCVAGSSIRAIAADGAVTCEIDDAGPANAFVQGGNAFASLAVLGTTDNRSLDLRVNNLRVMRYQPDPISPNIIGGNPNNSVSGGVRGAVIGGGGVPEGDGGPNFNTDAPNSVADHFGTIGGGFGNRAGDGAGTAFDSALATVGGGGNNDASGYASTISGGSINAASHEYATVSGGELNTASGASSVVGGGSSNDANGDYSTVPGGLNNEASGDHSFAAGRNARALHRGAFVWTDSNPFTFSSVAHNSFRVRATGGMRVVTEIDAVGAMTWSCVTTAGNAWSCASDRSLKHSLVELDGRQVLSRLAAMPVYQWQPKGKNGHVKHYGPMAQDFHAAFGLGDDDKMIGMQDADGVALAAIQGLNAKVEERLEAQRREIERLRAELVELRSLREDLASMRAARVERLSPLLDPVPLPRGVTSQLKRCASEFQ